MAFTTVPFEGKSPDKSHYSISNHDDESSRNEKINYVQVGGIFDHRKCHDCASVYSMVIS